MGSGVEHERVVLMRRSGRSSGRSWLNNCSPEVDGAAAKRAVPGQSHAPLMTFRNKDVVSEHYVKQGCRV